MHRSHSILDPMNRYKHILGEPRSASKYTDIVIGDRIKWPRGLQAIGTVINIRDGRGLVRWDHEDPDMDPRWGDWLPLNLCIKQ